MKQNYRSANEEISGLRVALEESRANGDRLHRESELVVHNVNTWVQEQKCVGQESHHVFEGWGLGPVHIHEDGSKEVRFFALGGGDFGALNRLRKVNDNWDDGGSSDYDSQTDVD